MTVIRRCPTCRRFKLLTERGNCFKYNVYSIQDLDTKEFLLQCLFTVYDLMYTPPVFCIIRIACRVRRKIISFVCPLAVDGENGSRALLQGLLK